jgi:regulator of RNase E activity RraB
MTSSTTEYPDDADGDALRRVAGDGADMSRPMVIEFTVDAPDETAASVVAERVSARGYIPSIYRDEDGSITVCCAKRMLATYRGVVDAQAEINALCTPLGANCDGWGTWGNTQGR